MTTSTQETSAGRGRAPFVGFRRRSARAWQSFLDFNAAQVEMNEWYLQAQRPWENQPGETQRDARAIEPGGLAR